MRALGRWILGNGACLYALLCLGSGAWAKPSPDCDPNEKGTGAPTVALPKVPEVEAPPPATQFDAEAMAACLGDEVLVGSHGEYRRRYGFDPSDGLLPYLAVYPANRYRLWISRFYDVGLTRWSGRWNESEERLARALVDLAPARAGGRLTPGEAFGLALRLCGGEDVFCASLTLHNVLRTFGRWAEGIEPNGVEGGAGDHNPEWFRRDRDHWKQQSVALLDSLMVLRRDGKRERWGEWYHLMGVVIFAMHERALYGPRVGMQSVRTMVRANTELNQVLVGSPMEPGKRVFDQDAIRAAEAFLSRIERFPTADRKPRTGCREPATYLGK